MSTDIKFEIPTWDEIYWMLLNLADKIRKENFSPDIIVGISRGGWSPARVMSDLLENPNLASVRVEFYSGIAEAEGEPVLSQPVSMPVEGKGLLLLDDVVDTGKSLQLVTDHVMSRGVSETRTATIYYKPWSVIKPDYYERTTRNWVVFPWERKETVRRLFRDCRKTGISVESTKTWLTESGMSADLAERFFNEIMKEEHL